MGLLGTTAWVQTTAIYECRSPVASPLPPNGLASEQMLNDFAALQRANTPDEMKREAERMKRERALIAENARLKQGLVQPQSFDNSQGAAEAAPNDARLLDAYINGDRSEAAIKAVERSMNSG